MTPINYDIHTSFIINNKKDEKIEKIKKRFKIKFKKWQIGT